jgi:hypothetical protein
VHEFGNPGKDLNFESVINVRCDVIIERVYSSFGTPSKGQLVDSILQNKVSVFISIFKIIKIS